MIEVQEPTKREEIHYWLGGLCHYVTDAGERVRLAMIDVFESIWDTDHLAKIEAEVDCILIADASYPVRLGYFGKDHLTIIVLSSELCNASVDEQRFTIAHELAHVVLGHHETGSSGGSEREAEADALATIWGFTCPPSLES